MRKGSISEILGNGKSCEPQRIQRDIGGRWKHIKSENDCKRRKSHIRSDASFKRDAVQT